MAIYIGINTTNKNTRGSTSVFTRESNVVQHHQTGVTLTPTRASYECKGTNKNRNSKK